MAEWCLSTLLDATRYVTFGEIGRIRVQLRFSMRTVFRLFGSICIVYAIVILVSGVVTGHGEYIGPFFLGSAGTLMISRLDRLKRWQSSNEGSLGMQGIARTTNGKFERIYVMLGWLGSILVGVGLVGPIFIHKLDTSIPMDLIVGGVALVSCSVLIEIVMRIRANRFARLPIGKSGKSP